MDLTKSKRILMFFVLTLTLLPLFQNCSGAFRVNDSAPVRALASIPFERIEGLSGLSSHSIETGTPYPDGAFRSISSNNLLLNIHNKHVFQRKESVTLNGLTTPDAAIVSLKFKKASPGVKWITVNIQLLPKKILLSKTYSVDPSSSAELSLPIVLSAGGWYTLKLIQVDEQQQISYISDVSQFGVGDIYLIAGQSNAAQHAEVKTSARNPLVVMNDPEKNTWVAASDPLPFASTDPNKALTERSNGKGQGSNWPELGDYLAQKDNVPIAFLNTAVGGTTISQWQPSAQAFYIGANLENDFRAYPLYDRLRFAARSLQEKSGGFKMILWHQGESDLYAEDCSTKPLATCAPILYTARFMQLKVTLDADLGINAKWLVARASFGPDKHPENCIDIQPVKPDHAEMLRKSQQALWTLNNVYQGPESDDLKEGYRYSGFTGACIHFSLAGQKEMAIRWFRAIEASNRTTASSDKFVDFSNQHGDYQCRIGQLCVSRTGGQNMSVYDRSGTSIISTVRCNGPWALDFTADHYTNICNGLTTVDADLNSPNHWQQVKTQHNPLPSPTPAPVPVPKPGLVRLVDRSQAKNGFVTSFDQEIWGAGEQARACSGIVDRVGCTKDSDFVLITKAWGTASYRKNDDVFIHKSNVEKLGFPMGNYFTTVIMANGSRYKLLFTPKDNTVSPPSQTQPSQCNHGVRKTENGGALEWHCRCDKVPNIGNKVGWKRQDDGCFHREPTYFCANKKKVYFACNKTPAGDGWSKQGDGCYHLATKLNCP